MHARPPQSPPRSSTESALDKAAAVLAARLETGLGRRALVKEAAGPADYLSGLWTNYAAPALTNVGQQASGLWDSQVTSRLGQQGGNALARGLAGAGVGAGLGALSSAFEDPRRRRPLSSMFTGGLIGGALGAGGSLAYDNAGGVNAPTVQHQKDLEKEVTRNTQETTAKDPMLGSAPGVVTKAQEMGLQPDQVYKVLYNMKHYGGDPAEATDFLTDWFNDPKNTTLPKGFTPPGQAGAGGVAGGLGVVGRPAAESVAKGTPEYRQALSAHLSKMFAGQSTDGVAGDTPGTWNQWLHGSGPVNSSEGVWKDWRRTFANPGLTDPLRNMFYQKGVPVHGFAPTDALNAWKAGPAGRDELFARLVGKEVPHLVDGKQVPWAPTDRAQFDSLLEDAAVAGGVPKQQGDDWWSTGNTMADVGAASHVGALGGTAALDFGVTGGRRLLQNRFSNPQWLEKAVSEGRFGPGLTAALGEARDKPGGLARVWADAQAGRPFNYGGRQYTSDEVNSLFSQHAEQGVPDLTTFERNLADMRARLGPPGAPSGNTLPNMSERQLALLEERARQLRGLANQGSAGEEAARRELARMIQEGQKGGTTGLVDAAPATADTWTNAAGLVGGAKGAPPNANEVAAYLQAAQEVRSGSPKGQMFRDAWEQALLGAKGGGPVKIPTGPGQFAQMPRSSLEAVLGRQAGKPFEVSGSQLGALANKTGAELTVEELAQAIRSGQLGGELPAALRTSPHLESILRTARQNPAALDALAREGAFLPGQTSAAADTLTAGARKQWWAGLGDEAIGKGFMGIKAIPRAIPYVGAEIAGGMGPMIGAELLFNRNPQPADLEWARQNDPRFKEILDGLRQMTPEQLQQLNKARGE